VDMGVWVWGTGVILQSIGVGGAIAREVADGADDFE
jgi:hypothetical protein